MERLKKRWAFLIKSEQDLKDAHQFVENNKFNKIPIGVKIGKYLVFNTHGTVQMSDEKKTLDNLNIPVFDNLYDSGIKPEFQSAFKRMFRINRVPNELTEEQIRKLTEEKVLELWKY